MLGTNTIRETDAIDYWSPDGHKCRAWRETRHGHVGFISAQNGDKSNGTFVDAIIYLAADGAPWCAKWSGDGFIHFPPDTPGDQHRAQVIDYVGWQPSTQSREPWQAYWDGRRQMFVQTRLARF